MKNQHKAAAVKAEQSLSRPIKDIIMENVRRWRHENGLPIMAGKAQFDRSFNSVNEKLGGAK